MAPLELELMLAASIPAIELEGVTRKYKSLVAVDNISLTFPQGQFTALLGPNGAGKTTLVEMIEGIQSPTSGSIKIFGMSWQGNSRKLHDLLGVALQETSFMDKVTVLETLDLFGSFYGKKRERSHEILELVGLADKSSSYVLHLSGGQKQRLVLGVALINNPRLLLLDEPTTGLDPSARRAVWSIIQNLRKNGTTLILTTHYMEEAEALCEQILIMDRGRILAGGTLAELSALSGGGEIVEFVCDRPLPDEINRLKGLRNLEHMATGSHTSYCLTVDSGTTFLPGLLKLFEKNNFSYASLECRRLTLDDLFSSLTGRHLDGATGQERVP